MSAEPKGAGDATISRDSDNADVAGIGKLAGLRESFLTRSWPLIALSVYYVICVLLIGTSGNFPINDDWVYSHGVQSLLDKGSIELPTSCSACFLHVALGAIACKLFGFSHVCLRNLTVMLGLASAFVFYFLLRELKVERRLAFLGSFVYLSNPLVLNLCFSFMTDISSFLFLNLYLLFTVRGIKRESWLQLALAGTMLLCAMLIRQGTMVFAIANLGLLLFSRKRADKVAIVICLVLLPLFLGCALDHWLLNADPSIGTYAWFRAQHLEFLKKLLHAPGKGLFKLLVMLGQVSSYLALYCVPLLISFVAVLTGLFQKTTKVAAWWFVASSACVVAALTKLVVGNHKLMPFGQDMLRLPPVGLIDVIGMNSLHLGSNLRLLLTLICGFFAILLLSVLGAALQRVIGNGIKRLPYAACNFVAFAGFVFALLVVVLESALFDFDRHYMLAFPSVILCLILAFSLLNVKLRWLPSLLASISVAVFSLAAAQDALAWDRARWQACNYLESQGIRSAEMDGGAEYMFVKDLPLWVESCHRGNPRTKANDRFRWWRVRDDKYIVGLWQVPGYDVIGTRDYMSFLTLGKRQILILKRSEPR